MADELLEQPIPCVIISDPGEDLDDEMAMIMLRHLVDKKLLDCQGVVVNLKPSLTRARLMRGTLDTLGLRGVPVGVGTDGGSSMHRETFCETAKVYIPDEHEQRTRGLLTGRGLLHRIFVDAEPKSLHLICISSLKDAALFMRDNMVLFVEKVNSVTIMGGVHEFAEADETGLLQPDTAQNNVFDLDASTLVYSFCIEHRIPMHVVSRDAVCPVPMALVRNLRDKSNHPLMKYLYDAQSLGLVGLWAKASETPIMRILAQPCPTQLGPRSSLRGLVRACGGLVRARATQVGHGEFSCSCSPWQVPPRKPTDHLVSLRMMVVAYGTIGLIETAAAYYAFWVVLTEFGFGKDFFGSGE